MTYPGGKEGAGVYQRIINQMPPHDVYVEPFLGDGAVLRHKRPATRNVGVEADPSVAAAFVGRAPGVEIWNCCGIEWLKFQFGMHLVPPPEPSARAALRWMIYADPPYLLSTRKGGPLYKHELTDEQHADLLQTLVEIGRRGAFVIISGYNSDLYRETLREWRLNTFQTMTRGGPATECLWMNYGEPAELHDYQHLGADKREREKLKRRTKNWTAGLARMPLRERRQIEQAIADALEADF